jgi:putative transposase
MRKTSGKNSTSLLRKGTGVSPVVSRGEALFCRDDDRRAFLGLVSELPERFGTEVHAFVRMDNHYHLLVRSRRTDLRETLREKATVSVARNR